MKLHLVPTPRRLELTGELVPAPPEWSWGCADNNPGAPALARLDRALARLAATSPAAGATTWTRRDVADAWLRIERDDAVRDQLGAEGYRLSLRPRGALLVAATSAGVDSGLTTLMQILTAVAFERLAPSIDTLAPIGLPGLEIDDRPALPHRGVMLDVSRNRVPRMDHLEQRIEQLASWKVNHLQLYMEHTFAYRGHEVVWRDDDPFTPEQIQDLDAFCRARHIELAPNQNSFGHFHRWLVHDRYRPLAEVPEGVSHMFGPEPEPFSLCAVDTSSLALLEDLYDQLLPNFSGETFNVGLDETFDLGQGRSAAACALKGKHQVYLDYLLSVHRLVAERDRRMQFWSDIVLEHPRLVPRLPRDSTCLLWGYEADFDFFDRCARLQAAEMDYWVCPGTSSWLSFAGRADNAVANLQGAASAGQRHDADGLMVTDWGDWGHMQAPWTASLGLLVGAALAWNPDGGPGDGRARSWSAALDRHVFDDPSGILSQAALTLANLHQSTGTSNVNASVLFQVFRFMRDDLNSPRYRGLQAETADETAERALAAVEGIAGHQSGRADGALLVAELEWTAEMLALGAELLAARRRAGWDRQLGDLDDGVRRRFAGRLDEQRHRLEELWMQRARPGGWRRTNGLLQRWTQQLAPPPSGSR